ncbi:MAG: PQQ-dependent sugar dehydrogenase [Planctomycetota bacterium]|nr:PQQ-dependent sugar dehydrogenase [Planctomycetota bacterium]
MKSVDLSVGLGLGLAALLGGTLAHAQSVDQLWENNCLKCHGDRGQGGGAGTRTLLDESLRDLTGSDISRRFYDAIREGHEDQGMPAFGEALTPAQSWALVNKIREFQEAARRRAGNVAKPGAKGVYASKHHQYRVERVVERGLDVPWGVAFITSANGDVPAGTMLITERPGSVFLHSTGKPGGRLSDRIRGTPEVRNRGQGGMMEVAVHPRFAENGWIYLGYTERHEANGRDLGLTKVVRGRLKKTGDDWSWTDQQTIFEGDKEHYTRADLHFGIRIAFDPADDSILYFAIGDRGEDPSRGAKQGAQDLTRPNGKVYRVKDDGSIPSDNPFVGTTAESGKVYEGIWSFGHRNPQGLTFDLNGNLWTTEHGPRGGDELNLVLKGRNYGWPIVSFGIQYSGVPFRTPWPDTQGAEAQDKDIAMPTYVWLPSIGACGLDVARGPDAGGAGGQFPKWQGDLLAGGLSGQNVDRIRVRVQAEGQAAGAQVVEREELIHFIGRVRDVVTGPDGSIYVVLNDPDSVIRLVNAG